MSHTSLQPSATYGPSSGGGAGDVPSARLVSAGNGLTGGGDLSADRSFAVAPADASIAVGVGGVAVGILQTDAQHGARGGAALHAAATNAGMGAGDSGFLTGPDKNRLDRLAAWGLAGLPFRLLPSDPQTATTGPLPAHTADLGAGTLTASANGAFPTVDGVAPFAFMLVLVKDEPDAREHWVYQLTTEGDAGTPWQLTRIFDGVPGTGAFMNTAVNSGGVTNGGTWAVVTEDPITIGVTEVVWEYFGLLLGAITVNMDSGSLVTSRQFQARGVNTTDGGILATQVPFSSAEDVRLLSSPGFAAVALRLVTIEVDLSVGGVTVDSAANIPANFVVLAVSATVLTDITGPAAWRYGLASDPAPDRWGDALALPAATSTPGFDTIDDVLRNLAAVPIRVGAADGVTAFTGGTVRFVVHGIEIVPPGTGA